jgi:hypothetical protein
MKRAKRIIGVIAIVVITVMSTVGIWSLAVRQNHGDTVSASNNGNGGHTAVTSAGNDVKRSGTNRNAHDADEENGKSGNVRKDATDVQSAIGDGSDNADVTVAAPASVPDAASKGIDDIMIYGVATNNADIVDTARASELVAHPDTGRMNMLSSDGDQVEAMNIARSSFEMMDWGTVKHADSVTKQENGLVYLTRTYTGRLTDGRSGKLTVDVIYEADTNKLAYALLTSFTATRQLPSGTMETDDMLASGV